MDEHMDREIVAGTFREKDVQGFARAVAVRDIGKHRHKVTCPRTGRDYISHDSVEIRDMAADSK
jgi:transposase-like protein